MRSVTALFFLLFWPGLASAQNLIPFASFDTSLDLQLGWGNLSEGKVWSSVDIDNSSSSGSLLMIHDQRAGSGILVWSSCVAVDEGQAYEFGGWHFTQFLQPGTGFARVTVQWYDSCGGSFLDEESETSSVVGLWTEIAGRAVAPDGAGGARLQLVNGKTTGNEGEERRIHFDEVFLPEPGQATAGLAVMVALALLRRSRRDSGCGAPGP